MINPNDDISTNLRLKHLNVQNHNGISNFKTNNISDMMIDP